MLHFFRTMDRQRKVKRDTSCHKKGFEKHFAKCLRFEQLESREMLTTLTWTGAVNDKWSISGNWTGGGLGGATFGWR